MTDSNIEAAAKLLYTRAADRARAGTGLPLPQWDDAPQHSKEFVLGDVRALADAGLLTPVEYLCDETLHDVSMVPCPYCVAVRRPSGEDTPTHD